jgi:hypothetical protein
MKFVDQALVSVKAGDGGSGNARFAALTNQAPRRTEPGEARARLEAARTGLVARDDLSAELVETQPS